jgi:hypothetical protein
MKRVFLPPLLPSLPRPASLPRPPTCSFLNAASTSSPGNISDRPAGTMSPIPLPPSPPRPPPLLWMRMENVPWSIEGLCVCFKKGGSGGHRGNPAKLTFSLICSSSPSLPPSLEAVPKLMLVGVSRRVN